MATLLVLVGLAGPALTQGVAGVVYAPDSAVAWARAQIIAGKVADFDVKCPPVERLVEGDPCRTIAADRVADLILAEATAGSRRVDIARAVIEGRLDLRDADVKREVSLERSLIEGGVDLSRARFASRLSFQGSTVSGLLDGSGLRVGGDLRLESAVLDKLKLNEAEIQGPLSLASAKVAHEITMPNVRIGVDLNLFDARIHGDVHDDDNALHSIDGGGAQIGGRLFAKNLQADGMLFFGDASTRGDVWFEGGDIGAVSLDSAHVGSTLHFFGAATIRDLVTLDGANIDHYLELRDAHFGSGLSAQAIHIGQEASVLEISVRGLFKLNNARIDGDLTIRSSSFSDVVDARGLVVRGLLKLTGSEFLGDFELASARIDGSLTARGTHWARPAMMRLVHVGQDLDLSEATLPGLDLSGGAIDGMLSFSGAGATKTCWSEAASPQQQTSLARRGHCNPAANAWARLLHARAGAVQGVFDGWPDRLELSGFTYTRIDVAPEGMRASDVDAGSWDKWLKRDRNFSPQHYLQLSMTLAADGNRERAQDMQLASRERERGEACAEHRVLTCGLLTLLWAVAGYGIGDYTWRAVYWVIGLTLLGAVFVWLVRRAESRDFWWSIGAALERLLPYVRLDRSFTEFFEKQVGFRVWHKIAFGILALMGSVLGLFLAAAASGLTQKG